MYSLLATIPFSFLVDLIQEWTFIVIDGPLVSLLLS
jgi:hypothetical protein